jgi:DNA-binding XRE family transcriptional regulator
MCGVDSTPLQGVNCKRVNTLAKSSHLLLTSGNKKLTMPPVGRKYKTLADYLDQTGTTQDFLAEKLGVSRSYVSLLASGERQPALPLALRIEALTGVPVESLVAGERAS